MEVFVEIEDYAWLHFLAFSSYQKC